MVTRDGGIELVIPAQFDSLIRKLNTPREKMNDKQVKLIS